MVCDKCEYKDKCKLYLKGSKDCVYEILGSIKELEEDAKMAFERMKKE